MKKILFRTDSSSTIGTGHIMRDLVLADHFKKDKVVFACRNLENNINYKITNAGYDLELLESNDIDRLINLINRYKFDLIIIDHYEIDYKYEKLLKEKTGINIFVFDDTILFSSSGSHCQPNSCLIGRVLTLIPRLLAK